MTVAKPSKEPRFDPSKNAGRRNRGNNRQMLGRIFQQEKLGLQPRDNLARPDHEIGRRSCQNYQRIARNWGGTENNVVRWFGEIFDGFLFRWQCYFPRWWWAAGSSAGRWSRYLARSSSAEAFYFSGSSCSSGLLRHFWALLHPWWSWDYLYKGKFSTFRILVTWNGRKWSSLSSSVQRFPTTSALWRLICRIWSRRSLALSEMSRSLTKKTLRLLSTTRFVSLLSLELINAHKCVCLNWSKPNDSRKVPKVCFEFIKLIRHTASGDNRSALAVQNCLHYSVLAFLLGSL